MPSSFHRPPNRYQLAIRKRKNRLHAKVSEATEGRLLLGAAYLHVDPPTAPPVMRRQSEAPRAPIVKVKREVAEGSSSIESAEFVLDHEFDVKPPQVELDPRQLGRGIAALASAPPPASESSSASGDAGAPGPSNWGIRSAPLNRIPEGYLGPADPPQRRGRPGSKTRLRVAFSLVTLPERKEKIEAEKRLAQMKPSKLQV